MFGIVPRTLWERTNPPDEKNRIKMTSNCLFITDGRIKALVEAGLGARKDSKFRDIYAVEGQSIDIKLAELGVDPEDIHVVILSHLHFDHCGGAVRIAGRKNGEFIPTFPKAIHFIQKKELDAAFNPNEKTRASYIRHNFEPLLKAKQVKRIDGDCEIYPGLSVFIADGHTEGMQCTLIEGSGKKLFFSADLFPLKAHINLPYIMSYDLFPLKTLETKKKIIPKAIGEKWLMTFAHDADTPFAHLEEEEGKVKVRPAIVDA
ncbi:MAG: MBL fold metallo-hydrolase [Acidobacteriota bacterium]